MRGWLRGTAGGLPRTFWYLWLALVVNEAGAFAILFLSLYLTGPRHLSPATAGLVVGGFGAGGAIGTVTGGVLADRWGRRRTLLLAYTVGGALMVSVGMVSPVPVIAALVALVGFFAGMPPPALVAAMVDVLPEEDRIRAFNLEFWAWNVGATVAALVAGLVAEVSFTLLFVLDGGSTLVVALLILLKVPESLPHRVDGGRPGPERGGLRRVLTDRIFMTFVGLTLVQGMLWTQTSTILPLSMKADHLRPSAYGLVMSVAAALVVVGQLFVPRVIRGRRKGSVLAAGMASTAVAFVVVALANNLPVYLLAAVVWTVGSMLAAPPNAAVIAELAPATVRARYQAVFYLAFGLAGVLAPALGGVSFQELGGWHWVICAALGIAGAGGHLAASGPRERRVAATREPVETAA